jgi:hypothetical protein
MFIAIWSLAAQMFSLYHLVPDGKNVLLFHYVPGGNIFSLSLLVPGGTNPINVRPLWGRFKYLVLDGNIFSVYHFGPWRQHIFIVPFGPWRHKSYKRATPLGSI